MNRRAFFAAIAAATATAVLDPERALWIPRRKIYSIPKPRLLDLSEIYVEALEPSVAVVSEWWEDFDGVHHRIRAHGYTGPIADVPFAQLPIVRLDLAKIRGVTFMMEMTREEFRLRYPDAIESARRAPAGPLSAALPPAEPWPRPGRSSRQTRPPCAAVLRESSAGTPRSRG